MTRPQISGSQAQTAQTNPVPFHTKQQQGHGAPAQPWQQLQHPDILDSANCLSTQHAFCLWTAFVFHMQHRRASCSCGYLRAFPCLPREHSAPEPAQGPPAPTYRTPWPPRCSRWRHGWCLATAWGASWSHAEGLRHSERGAATRRKRRD